MTPDAAALRAFRRSLSLPPERIFDDEEVLSKYGKDWSRIEGYQAQLVIKPESTQEVQDVLHHAHTHRIPVTPRGLVAGKAGGAIPMFGW